MFNTLLERENLVENSHRWGRYLYERAMAALRENPPTVGHVGGGLGLLMAIELAQSSP